MQAEERAAWLRLALTPGLGPGTARALLREFGLPTALFDAPLVRLARCCGEDLARSLHGPAPAPLLDALQRAQDWLDGAPERFLLSLADTDYPPGLLDLSDPPLLLYAQGRRERLGQAAIAIVGSRSATRQGVENAAAFAAHLGRAGLCIVSGLARGIDTAAHRGALAEGCATIAVLGTGSDIVYPAANRALAAEIGREGLLLSEYALGTPALTHNFPRRNRLIAAWARGVLVVEAAVHSGSLITARIAAELGREVFAIPGSIHSPQARGCHRLIRDGAKLVESAQDVLEELHGPPTPSVAAATQVGRSPGAPVSPADASAADASEPAEPRAGHRELLAALGHDPVDMDTLSHRTGWGTGQIAAALLELELAGRVECLPGNRYQRLHRASP